MKVVLVGANFRNRGAEAMLLTTMASLVSRWPQADITVASYAPDDARENGEHSWRDPNGWQFRFSLVAARSRVWPFFDRLAFLSGLHSGSRSRGASPYIRALVQADLVIDLSGFALSDRRPAWRSVVAALEAVTCRRAGVPLVLMTQAFGPFDRWLVAASARFALRRATLITARGETSATHLSQLGLARNQQFGVAQDVAWNFLAASLPGSPDLPDCALFGVVPNTNIHRQAQRQGRGDDYVELLAAVCKFVHDRLGARAVLIGHESCPGTFDDDRLAEAVCGRVPQRARPHLVPATLRASEIKAVIGRCEFALVSRFHALIAAQSQGVPEFALGWAHKYAESIVPGQGSARAMDYSPACAKGLLEALQRAWDRRGARRRELLQAGPGFRESARSPFDQIARLVAGRQG